MKVRKGPCSIYRPMFCETNLICCLNILLIYVSSVTSSFVQLSRVLPFILDIKFVVASEQHLLHEFTAMLVLSLSSHALIYVVKKPADKQRSHRLKSSERPPESECSSTAGNDKDQAGPGSQGSAL